MSSFRSFVLSFCSSGTTKCSSGWSPQNRVFCRCNEMSGICSENSSCRKRIMCLNKKNSGKNYEEIGGIAFCGGSLESVLDCAGGDFEADARGLLSNILLLDFFMPERIQKPAEPAPWGPKQGDGGGPRSPDVSRPDTKELLKKMRKVDPNQSKRYRQRTGQ